MDKKNKNPNVPTLRFAGYIDNYRTCKLIDISEIITRTNENNSEYPIMMISAGKGFIAQSEKYSRDNAGTSINKYILLKKGELAYNRGNSKQFPYGAIYEMKEEYALIPYVYHCFNIYNGSTRYFSYYLNSPFKDEQLSKIITSSVRGNGLLNISKKDFFNLSLNVPSIKEQNKIANFLDLIENRIQTQIKIINDLVLQKKYIISSLLKSVQDKEMIMLKDILFDYNVKSTINNEYPVLSSTASGMYLQTEYFNKEASSDNTIGYKIIPRGYCTYRSMSDTGLFTFNVQNLVEKGIVSPAYPVFSSNDYINEFIILYLNNSSYIKKQILELKSGGTRFALPFSTLCTLKIPKLEKEKQLSLIKIITAFETKIENEEKILDTLHQQKIFLLNNMFI